MKQTLLEITYQNATYYARLSSYTKVLICRIWSFFPFLKILKIDSFMIKNQFRDFGITLLLITLLINVAYFWNRHFNAHLLTYQTVTKSIFAFVFFSVRFWFFAQKGVFNFRKKNCWPIIIICPKDSKKVNIFKIGSLEVYDRVGVPRVFIVLRPYMYISGGLSSEPPPRWPKTPTPRNFFFKLFYNMQLMFFLFTLSLIHIDLLLHYSVP